MPLPAHTMGHCGVALDTDQRWLPDAGDVYFDSREVHQAERECAVGVGLFQKVVTTDKSLRFRSQDQLRQLLARHPDVRVFAAHDPGGLAPGPSASNLQRPARATTPKINEKYGVSVSRTTETPYPLDGYGVIHRRYPQIRNPP